MHYRLQGLYRGAEPVTRGGGATGPPCRPWVGPSSRPRGGGCRPWGGDRPPLPPRAPGQGPLCKFEEKNYIKVLSPPPATGVYFRNFSKRTYIFEILIFFKYKKEKIANFFSLENVSHAKKKVFRGAEAVVCTMENHITKLFACPNGQMKLPIAICPGAFRPCLVRAQNFFALESY